MIYILGIKGKIASNLSVFFNRKKKLNLSGFQEKKAIIIYLLIPF